MTKTNEFRIKETDNYFIVERRFSGWASSGYFGRKQIEVWKECKRIDFYWLGVWFPHEVTVTFLYLDSAKEFIANELKEETKPKEETIIYHQYP